MKGKNRKQGKTVSFELTAEEDGYFSGTCMEAQPGSLYRFRLDDGKELFPDPASRFQPEGPHGPSCVVDPVFAWTDQNVAGAQARRTGAV